MIDVMRVYNAVLGLETMDVRQAIGELCLAVDELQGKVAVSTSSVSEPIQRYGEPPLASPTGISTAGRHLYTVAGEFGLWATKRDYSERDSESVIACRERRRGRPSPIVLFLQVKLTTDLAAILAKQEGGAA
jgi:hypothetical protein